LYEGQIIAIEPFVTVGTGKVTESGRATIFEQVGQAPVRVDKAILKEIESYKRLPFTTRWLTRKFPKVKVKMALQLMTRAGILVAHPPLVDKGLVSQHEYTLRVTKDGCEVLTRCEQQS